MDAATGRPKMVDVGAKQRTTRSATAVGRIHINEAAFALVQSAAGTRKGDVLTVAQLAGIMAAKHTPTLIPLCHSVALDHVTVDLALEPATRSIAVRATATVVDARTGVEMEALVAATTACLTVWDMVKAVSGRDMRIDGVRVVAKSGGRSGDWDLERD